MAQRQRDTVQGRITDGTLFPNISIAIGNQVDKLTDKILNQLQEKVLGILVLIRSDLEMALGKEAKSRLGQKDREELEQRQVILRNLLKTLKEKHEKILKDISSAN